MTQVLFLFGVLEFGMNTTMYSFDPGFQIDESYQPAHRVCQWITRFLVGICISLVLIFAARVYTYWPTLILRHKNHVLVSGVFFMFTTIFLFKDDPHAFASSGKAFLTNALLTNLYVFLLQRLFSVSKQGLQEISNAKYLPPSKDAKSKTASYEIVNTSVDPEEDFDNELKPDN